MCGYRPGTDQAVRYEDTQLTQAVRDHVWQFSDVRLDIPDQSVQCAPQIEVPYLDGTATLTRLEIHPPDHHSADRRAGPAMTTTGGQRRNRPA